MRDTKSHLTTPTPMDILPMSTPRCQIREAITIWKIMTPTTDSHLIHTSPPNKLGPTTLPILHSTASLSTLPTSRPNLLLIVFTEIASGRNDDRISKTAKFTVPLEIPTTKTSTSLLSKTTTTKTKTTIMTRKRNPPTMTLRSLKTLMNMKKKKAIIT